MVPLQVQLDHMVERELRKRLRKKGDLSRIVTEAVKEWLEKHYPEED